jgi:hypothetical protein
LAWNIPDDKTPSAYRDRQNAASAWNRPKLILRWQPRSVQGNIEDDPKLTLGFLPASPYKAIGFRPGGEPFLHQENGISHPLVLDAVKYGKKLSNERSLRTYLNMIVKAKFLKLIEGMRAA